MKFKKEELIKSPLNYTGGKYKLLPQILPHFPEDINTFVDLFAGGCNVGINVKANNIVCNDIDKNVISLLNHISNNVDTIEDDCYETLSKYNLNKNNKEGYLKLRNDYNDSGNNLLFLMLIFHSFNNQIRFNKKGFFNLPFGGRTLNKNLKGNLHNFIEAIKIKNIHFLNNDFDKCINIESLNTNDLIYLDPPYSLAFKEYNGQNFWNIEDDKRMFEMLDKLNDNGIKFVLSNVFECKGKVNMELIKWSKKYKIVELSHSYKNCNYIRNNKKDTEILILNY